ncbi:MAG: lasso RiPP family leader peptide-containing protein [Actinobacteria bacterium]|nr:lasso RiPP family leader peptide-containing protein [Actinomycetota bacterium]
MRKYEAPTVSVIGSVEELTLETTVAAVDNEDGGNS